MVFATVHPHLTLDPANAHAQQTEMILDTHITLGTTFFPALSILAFVLSLIAFAQGKRTRRQTTRRIREVQTEVTYLIRDAQTNVSNGVADPMQGVLSRSSLVYSRSLSRLSPTPSNLSSNTLNESVSGDTLVQSESSDDENEVLVDSHHRPARFEFGLEDELGEDFM
jgi:hypothetical protein